MATIDLGKIKMVWRGTYAGGTAYVPDDVVEYTDTGITSTYICTAASTGNAPSSGGTAHGSWAYMAKGVPGTPTTTRGDIIYRGASADQRLAKGTAGKVLTMGANDPEWGNAFQGTHYLGYSNDHSHGSTVTIIGSNQGNGSADNQRDCVVINNGLYHTITPSHNDDILVMGLQTTVYSNWTSGGSYWGLGFMSSTTTNFVDNRNNFYHQGQHSNGNGSGGGDEYRVAMAIHQFKTSDISLTTGTTYYIRGIGQVHTTAREVKFNNNNGTNTRARYNCWIRHYKRNV